METYKRTLKQSYELRDIADCARIDERKLVAIRLLQRKTPIEDVVFLTNLTKEQVQELLEED
ncbi:MAG: hypothetical protein LBK45_04700 [Tannerellaceae bacterium]|jgi:hypothetical protein|nr:hypothetical protein [Tannerellaceae bacterium]